MERDPETGKIVRVIHDKVDNPLGDLLNDVEDREVDGDAEGREGQKGEGSEIVRMLEEQASMEREKPKRKQSEREKEWIEKLVARWGEDYKSMMRDRRLNPMQQTEADIKRRIQKWKADGGTLVAKG